MVEEKIITYKGVRYIVSSDGHIYSTSNLGRAKYHKEITQRLSKDGYMCITCGRNDNRTRERVHRIVATAFIPNPENLPEVNHKDLNRTNNNVDNLEWCTHEYNIQYSVDKGSYANKDISGEKNPNWGKHTLREKYKNNPELAKQNNARNGSQNGKAKAVTLRNIHENKTLKFGCLLDAAKYLINNKYTKNKINTITNKISCHAKNNDIIYDVFEVIC